MQELTRTAQGIPLLDPGRLVAELFAPHATDSLPALILIGGAEDGVPARRLARRIGREGYAVIAVAPAEVQAEDFRALIARLQSLAPVDASRIGVLGLGSGAACALQRAAEQPEIRAVVAVAPGAGEQLPVERIAGPILLVAGIDDARWEAVEMADRIVERLAEHRFAHGVSLHSYGSAGHWLFGPPIHRADPLALRLAELGGTPDGNVTARLDAWRKTLGFLDDTLGRRRPANGRPLLIHDDCWIPG